MSTIITHAELEDRKIMVRAYASEPVRLLAGSQKSDDVIEVVGRNNLSIGFPADDVFQLDNTLYRELSEHYSSGDTEALAKAWHRAVPFRAA